MGARDDRALGELLRAAGDGVHRHVGRAAGRAREGEAGAEGDEVVRGERERGAREAERGDQARGDPQTPAVKCPPGQQHRRQRTHPDEQQRQTELAVVDAGLVLDARDRGAPRAPEGAEGGEGDVGGRDQIARQAANVAARLNAR